MPPILQKRILIYFKNEVLFLIQLRPLAKIKLRFLECQCPAVGYRRQVRGIDHSGEIFAHAAFPEVPLCACYKNRFHKYHFPHRSVSYTHLRAHETDSYLVCRLLLEKKKTI